MSRFILTRSQWLNVTTTGVRALSAIGAQKIIALRYGPAGVLALGQFLLLQGLCYGLLTDGLNRAILVEAGQAPNLARRLAVLAKGGVAAALLLTVTALVAWQALPTVLPNAAAIALPMALAIAAAGWFWWTASTLQFENWPAIVLLLTVLQATALAGGALFPLEYLPGWVPRPAGFFMGELALRLLLMACFQAIISLASGFSYLFILRRAAGKALAMPSNLLNKIGTYGGLSLAILLAGRGADLLVRTYALHLGYVQELGLWQASVRLGEMVMTPFNPLFATVFFAQAAQMQEVPTLRKALRPQLATAAGGVGVIAIIWLLSPYLLPLLNRPDFLASTAYYNRQVPGDMLRLLSLPLSIALLAGGRLKALAWLEALSLGTFLLAAAGFSRWLGPLGLPIAHTVRYAVFFAATVYAARDLLPWAGKRGKVVH